MPRYVINATNLVTGVTKRFRLTATGFKQALARLFTQKPEYDVASGVTIGIAEDPDEDIT